MVFSPFDGFVRRDDISVVRCGNAAGKSGPSYLLPPGKVRHPDFTNEFLEKHGAARFTSIVMTENGFGTDAAWKEIMPKLCAGLRYIVEKEGAKYGIDAVTCVRLKILLGFDGFGSHWKNLEELVYLAQKNILARLEDRDSSSINQVDNMHLFS